METIYTFHESVRGHLHILNNIPCEDYSASFSSENGKYHIAIVADGHGDKTCFRSAIGSKIATEVTLKCLQQFAGAILLTSDIEEKFYNDIKNDSRYRQMTLKQLTDSIVARWYDAVTEHYQNNIPNPEEYGDIDLKYRNPNDFAHIYGTTIMGALLLPECLLLVHQGDGRCDVFYKNGDIDQPIPWDERCQDTAVTSLCDIDVVERFRSCIIDTVQKPILACYLGTDGVEDAYRDTYEGIGGTHCLMGGVHTFFKDLTYQIGTMTKTDFENYLPQMLSEFSEIGRFSKTGSGDDVSVSGIVDYTAVNDVIERFSKEVCLYDLEEKLFWKEDELRGKSRKYGILQRRVKDYADELSFTKSEYEETAGQISALEEKRKLLCEEIDKAKAELDSYQEESQSATNQIETKYSAISAAIQRFVDEMSTSYSVKETEYKKKLALLEKIDDEIKNFSIILVEKGEKLKESEVKYSDTVTAFEEYASKVRKIDSERIEIEKQISQIT